MPNALVLALSVVVIGASGPVWGGASSGRDEPPGGAIQGVARDTQQQAMRSLTVRVRDVQSGQLAASGTTNTSGEFLFAGLQPGNYIVEALDAPGRIIATTSPIAVRPGAVMPVKVTVPAAPGARAAAGGGGLFGRSTGALLGITGAAATVGIMAAVATRSGKIVICHKPAGQPAQTIEVSDNAKDAHLAHGDTLGACPISPSR